MVEWFIRMGVKRVLSYAKCPFMTELVSVGLMGFGRDITERKRYQDALENASRDKTTFISTIQP